MSTTEEHITVNGHWTLRKWTENEYKKYHNTMHEIHEFHVSKSWLEDSQFLKHFMTQMKNVDSRDDRRGQLTNIDQQRLQEIIDEQTPEFFCCVTNKVSLHTKPILLTLTLVTHTQSSG